MTPEDEAAGRAFRAAWIAGVRAHYPGEPKPGYVAEWDETPQWEREAAAAVHGQVVDFIAASGGATRQLTPEQRGRFIAICWTAQIHHRIENPKPAYVADWTDLPEWQKRTDIDVFAAIEHHNVK